MGKQAAILRSHSRGLVAGARIAERGREGKDRYLFQHRGERGARSGACSQLLTPDPRLTPETTSQLSPTTGPQASSIAAESVLEPSAATAIDKTIPDEKPGISYAAEPADGEFGGRKAKRKRGKRK